MYFLMRYQNILTLSLDRELKAKYQKMPLPKVKKKHKINKTIKKGLMLYSKRAIGILSLLLSPLLGSILFAANLRNIRKPALGPLFIIGSIFLAGLIRTVFPDTNPIFLLTFNNIVGSALLYFYFFDKFFGEYEYDKKNFWPPTLFFISSIAILLLAIYFKNSFLNH